MRLIMKILNIYFEIVLGEKYLYFCFLLVDRGNDIIRLFLL